MNNSTNEFWKGDFGDDYTKRNRVDWRARRPFWHEVLNITGARSVFEGGCNAGWNLSAIKASAGIHHGMVQVAGCDVNHAAAVQARMALGLHNATIMDGTITNAIRAIDWSEAFDLTFTAGVLIHIDWETLKPTMEALIDASAQYVLAVEYDSINKGVNEEPIEYRGHEGKLWRRDYGQIYQDMGLKLVKKWPAEGFDNCTAWLFSKI